MENPISRTGKPQPQSWQTPFPELANTRLHITEITTDIKAEAAATSALNKILVLQNEQDKILLTSLIEKFGPEKIGVCSMELIKKGLYMIYSG